MKILEFLSVPLVALLLSLALSVGTKSGSKPIFVEEDVNAFPSICDLFGPPLLPFAIALMVPRSTQSRHMMGSRMIKQWLEMLLCGLRVGL
ncbi:uncharacterized protein MONOS_13492 [Monocercomonoides exilis]|uniref:uncharacterized protein n=1 Tax=Monocercomonoides exilis TaxID=2049356 RepID=UPI003559B36E|nr:hypothetical protein MONOS_13492 [Monocercomonoides exilis]|eukprot:MONOS_13492.1-p1 / transcript=MONOS_13492.1 / gene=MONOS_13492 / organism=Monocercomonoides_exilis_PA203 / gene_product=unspecified product / transcript_product=unspecified product / location=Mono_scaffold00836:12860-13132(+) / protein_length=91 / sequence_SO=supercontig / SO=protein_coding / is_pseudo=false